MVFDIKIRFLEVFCFRWSNFQVCRTLGARKKRQIVLIGAATAPRPQATGRGRGGVNPSPGTGDWRFGQFLYTLVGPEGLGGFLGRRRPQGPCGASGGLTPQLNPPRPSGPTSV